jgi:hypothetical protein
MPVDFHSPVLDLEDLENQKVWDRRSDLVGIDFRSDAQEVFLLKIAERFERECDWLPNSSGDPHRIMTGVILKGAFLRDYERITIILRLSCGYAAVGLASLAPIVGCKHCNVLGNLE